MNRHRTSSIKEMKEEETAAFYMNNIMFESSHIHIGVFHPPFSHLSRHLFRPRIEKK